MKMSFMIPTDRELKAAEKWWRRLPNAIKSEQSIWVILAMYAEQVLKTHRAPKPSEQ